MGYDGACRSKLIAAVDSHKEAARLVVHRLSKAST